MQTEIYGASDDLIEFEGDCNGEVGAVDAGNLIVCGDGTVLAIQYGRRVPGVWGIDVLQKGSLFDRIEVCDDEDAKRYSDTVFLHDGLKRAWTAEQWQVVE